MEKPAFAIDLTARRQAAEQEFAGKKVDHHYQAVGLKLMAMFPKESRGTIWQIFSEPWCTPIKAEIAMSKHRSAEARQGKKLPFKYLIGIIKKL